VSGRADDGHRAGQSRPVLQARLHDVRHVVQTNVRPSIIDCHFKGTFIKCVVDSGFIEFDSQTEVAKMIV
jgi:hypothetical protein